MGFSFSDALQSFNPVSGWYASKQASRDRNFRLKMRDTQYQSAVQDLRRAGLNPILATQIGGNATPAAGAVGTMPGDSIATTGKNLAQKKESKAREKESTQAASTGAAQERLLNNQALTALAQKGAHDAAALLARNNAAKAAVEKYHLDLNTPFLEAQRDADSSPAGRDANILRRVFGQPDKSGGIMTGSLGVAKETIGNVVNAIRRDVKNAREKFRSTKSRRPTSRRNRKRNQNRKRRKR